MADQDQNFFIAAGGETGPAARECREDWFQAIREDCAAAGIPFFFKQRGGNFWEPSSKWEGKITWENVRQWPSWIKREFHRHAWAERRECPA